MSSRQTHIDWPRLLGDLQYLLGDPLFEGSAARQPVGTPALAKHLDVKRSTLVGWLEGSEPKHSQGEQLLVVWAQMTGKPREFAPITVMTFSAARVR